MDYTNRHIVTALRCCNTDGEGCVTCPFNEEDGCIRTIRNMAAEAIEQLDCPTPCRCMDDCCYSRQDYGDRYTPPSTYCAKDDGKTFEALNLEPCYGENDTEADVPTCPFYLNYEAIVALEAQYHYGEKVDDDRNKLERSESE